MGAEIDRLVSDKDITQLCPYYVDLQVEGPRLQVPTPPPLKLLLWRSSKLIRELDICMRGCAMVQAIVNKMKSISSTLTMVTTKHGHLHLQVAGEQVECSKSASVQGWLASVISCYQQHM